MTIYTAAVNLALAAATARGVRRPESLAFGVWIVPLVAFALSLPGLIVGPAGVVFAIAQGLTWWACVHVPVGLVGWAFLARAPARHRGGAVCVAVVFASVGAYATMVEPFDLEVSHVVIPSREGRMRIALLADIQTDDVGEFEQRVVDAVIAEKPDLVLFAGDYVQVADNDAYVRQTAALAAIIGQLHAPLGAFAVRGDVDGDAWELALADSGVTVVEESTTIELAQADGRPFWLTSLSVDDSRSATPPIPAREGLHIVLGHAPDYALGAAGATPDLMLAGHTHGGQIQIPGFGPIVTLTSVPRAWASGVSEMAWGGRLIVSRGIGMERLEAPRIRLFCRPEIVIIDLGPA